MERDDEDENDDDDIDDKQLLVLVDFCAEEFWDSIGLEVSYFDYSSKSMLRLRNIGF